MVGRRVSLKDGLLVAEMVAELGKMLVAQRVDLKVYLLVVLWDWLDWLLVGKWVAKTVWKQVALRVVRLVSGMVEKLVVVLVGC